MDIMCMLNAQSELYINYYNSMFVQLPAISVAGHMWNLQEPSSTTKHML